MNASAAGPGSAAGEEPPRWLERRAGEVRQSPAHFAIGVGYRKRCSAGALAALVSQALARLAAQHPAIAAGTAVLTTIAEKDRPVLRKAAEMLGLEVAVLPRTALRETQDRITVSSERVRACFGIPSVAEAAALAAAGPKARLVVTRMASPEATCAIAVAHPELSDPDPA